MTCTVLFGAVIIAPTARAQDGHDDVSYSGGTWTSTGTATITDDYGGTPRYGADIPTGGGFLIFGFPIFMPGPGTADCSGSVTATFTWDDEGDSSNLPPEVVLVKEYCKTEWGGDSGNCDNGFSDTLVTTSNGEYMEGTHWYAKQDPSTSFSVPARSPSADATHDAATCEENCTLSGTAKVEYTAEVVPVRLKFLGTKSETDKRLMIGQKFVAYVDYDGGTPASSTYTYSWTVGSGRPFTNYDHTASLGKLYPWVPVNQASAEFYFSKEGTHEMEVAVTIQTPTNPTINFTLSDDVLAIRPTLSEELILVGEPPEMMSGVYPALYVDNDSPKYLSMWNATYMTTTLGMWIFAKVDTHDDFDDTSHGIWYWTQLITRLNRWIKGDDDTFYDWEHNFADTEDPRLDKTAIYASQTHPANGQKYNLNDTPGQELAIPGLPDAIEVGADDKYDGWIMYKAPNNSLGDAMPVPLANATWEWNGVGVLGASEWSADGTSTNELLGYTNDYPEWDLNILDFDPFSWIPRSLQLYLRMLNN